MSPPARASVAFGVYALAMGALLAVAPNPVLSIFHLPPAQEPWVRIAAAMALALGTYYVEAGRHELVPFFRASVPGRLVFAAVVGGAAFAYDQLPLLLFAGVDAGTAALTAWLLSRRG